MENNQELPKKCFCARCFLPVDAEDKVDIEGQNFHRICSMCCICRTIPPALKMFYGHVFCNDCFKTHVLTRFRGENPRIHSNSWWMQWAPSTKQEGATEAGEHKAPDGSEETPKRCICARCLQMIDEANKLEIGGQTFHSQCAKCYFCHAVPTNNLKIYYGQVFCEECFNRHGLNRNKDNPSDFFKHCFDQWQNNAHFADNMKDFMAGNKDSAPFVFMMQGPQPPFCRCGTGPQEWYQNNEPKKSTSLASDVSASIGGDSLSAWDLSFENRTKDDDDDPSAIWEVANMKIDANAICEAASTKIDTGAIYEYTEAKSAFQKIEKLTKYLHGNEDKKWKNFTSINGTKRLACPSCLWQCGSIYLSRDMQMVCEVSMQ